MVATGAISLHFGDLEGDLRSSGDGVKSVESDVVERCGEE